MENPAPASAPIIDPANLPALLHLLGYVPAASGTAGVTLRGLRNPDGSLRWVWPTTLRQPLFLEFYSATSPKARLFSALVRLVFFCRLQGVFFRQLPGRYAATGEQSWPTADFAVFTGTPGPNRKAVCCYDDAAGQRVFAKLPLGPVAAQKVQAETAHLRALGQQEHAAFEVPQVLAAGPDFLLQSNVKRSGSRRAASFDPAHARCLSELLAATSVRQPIEASNCWHSIEAQVAALQNLDETRIPFGLRSKLRHLRFSIDAGQELSFAFAHGDFTPWNCWLGTEKLAIYDLELALPGASLLYDLFHFEVQQALLGSRRPALAIRTQALSVAAEHFPAVPTTELAVAWQLYLLHQVATGALLYHEQTTCHPQVTWLLNGWNALLTLELATVLEHRQLALYDLHDFVQLLPQPGVVLKPRADNPYYPTPTSDLDLLLRKDDVLASVQFLQEFGLLQSAVVRLAANMQSVDCLFLDGSLLTVDLLHQLHRQAPHLLDAEAVLGQAERDEAGVYVPSLTHDFTYTWLFYWLNHSDMPLGHLRYFQRFPLAQQADLLAHLQASFGLSFHNIAEASVYHEDRAAHFEFMLRRATANHRAHRWPRGLRYLLNTTAEFLRPGGLVITFSGMDGAEKSTVIEHVKERLEMKWRKRVVVIRHRPSLLPIISAWKYGKQDAEARSIQNLPRQGQNFGLGSSLARFAYYYLDYAVGQ